MYQTGDWPWGKTDYAANALVFRTRPQTLTFFNLTDGASQTILVGEKSLDPKNYGTGTWYWDEPFFTGGSGGTAREGVAIVRDAPGIQFPHNWGAAHPSGALFLFGDGAVHLLPYGTDAAAVRALLTPNGRDRAPDLW